MTTFQASLELHGKGLSYSNKRRFVLNIEEAKSAETRQRRIGKAVATLASEKI